MTVAGYPLKGKGVQTAFSNSTTETLVDGLVNCISKRFKGQEESSSLLKSTVIGSFRNWPSVDETEFGEVEVQQLTERFRNSLSAQGVVTEVSEMMTGWRLLKKLVYRRYHGQLKDVSLESVNSSFSQNGLDNIPALVDPIRSLPPTSVKNETSFNQMKLIKTDRRHRLSGKHLNDMMMIRLQSPSIEEFDPTTAVNKWMISPTCQRRRISNTRKQKPKICEAESDERENIEENISERGADESKNVSERGVGENENIRERCW